MDIDDYEHYRETKLHEVPGFSYNTYLCTIPQDFDHVAPHWHEQMEIIYVKKGRGTVSVNFRHLPVEAGSIVPVLPGEIHAIEGEPGGRMEYENIIFSLDMLDSREPNEWCRTNVIDPLRSASLQFERPIPPGTDFYERVREALDGADAACSRRADGYSLVVKSRLFLLLDALYIYGRPTPLRPSRSAEGVKQVIEEVRLNYARPLTVADAARIAGYSEAHFMRVFKRAVGQTFSQYLLETRLSAAAFSLETTADAVGQIALASGFDNTSYFNRRFKERFGMSPLQFRKSRQRETRLPGRSASYVKEEVIHAHPEDAPLVKVGG